MTDAFVDTRRDLRERAFQALMSLEYDGDVLEAVRFAYLHDREVEDVAAVDLPAFLLNLVNGVQAAKPSLDEQIASKLKSGWTIERLTLVEKNILRLGLFEIQDFDETPQIVAVNEAIELSKTFSDEKSAKFVNGILSQFVTEDKEEENENF